MTLPDLAPTTMAQSWQTYQHAAAAAAAASKDKLRVIVVDAIVLRVPWLLRELAPSHEAIRAQLSATRELAYQEALAALPVQLGALLFAHTQYTTSREVISSMETEALRGLDKRGAQLKELGMRWLEVLSILGKVPRQTLDVIRGGKGYLDRAGDLHQLAHLLGTHLQTIEAQTAQAEPGVEVITSAHIKEMGEVAAELLGILQGQRGPARAQTVDWKAQRAGCFLLCDASWECVRTAARFHFESIGDQESYSALVRLKGIHKTKASLECRI